MNKTSGVFYIRNGWANKFSQGDLCSFKLMENGEKQVLLLCPKDSRRRNLSTEEFLCSKEQRKKKNGIKEPGEIILLNIDGRKWSSYLHMAGREGHGKEWFYLRRGWREMCEANGVKVNDSFMMEFIWEGANPVFKFCTKITNQEKGNQRTGRKRACESSLQRVSQGPENQEDKKKRSNQASNQTNPRPRKVQRTQPKSCTVSDQVIKVRRSIVETLNSVKLFQSELKTREQNLEAALLEIDDLGEKLSGISKILNNNLK